MVGIFRENNDPVRISFGNSIFRRAVHVQSFQSPCTCTKMCHSFSLAASERANQELQNAFLDDSLAQKEAEIRIFKLGTLFAFFAHIARAIARKSQKVCLFQKIVS